MNVVTRIKRIALGALLAVLVMFGALLTLPYFAPRDEIRTAVTRSLVAATGVAPRIDGAAYFTILPRPSVRFEDVHFDGDSRTGLSAGSLRATVRLLPLIFGDVEIASLIFERPHIHIEVAADGTKVRGLPLRSPTAAGEIVNLPEIRISDGIVDIHLEGSKKIEQLSEVKASLAWSGTSLATVSSFRWHDMPSTASLFIADTATIGRGARSGVRFRLEADPLHIGFEGGLAFRKGIQADGSLTVESTSLRTVLASFGIELPTSGGFGPFSLKTKAQITPTALTASALAIELDGNRAEGSMTLAFDTGRPTLQGTLAANTADFSPYGGGFSMTTANGKHWSHEPLDIKALKGFDLDLRLSAGEIKFHKTEIEKVALAASVKAGRFTLSAGEGQIFGGVLRGTAAVGPSNSGAGAEVKIDANIKDFNSERGLEALAGIHQLEGTGSLTLALSGEGESVDAITHDLKGGAEISVQRGALKGINVEQVLRNIEKKPLSIFGNLRGGQTPFDRFNAKLAITGGTASLEEAEAESGSVRVTLGGRASIPQRDLDLKGTASLVQPAGAAPVATAFALPFFVRGSWDNPHMWPDTAALLRRSGVEFYHRLAHAAPADPAR